MNTTRKIPVSKKVKTKNKTEIAELTQAIKDLKAELERTKLVNYPINYPINYWYPYSYPLYPYPYQYSFTYTNVDGTVSLADTANVQSASTTYVYTTSGDQV